MNADIQSILEWRATVAHNAAKLIAHGSKSDSAQLSLFGSSSKELIQLDIPKDIDYNQLLEKEKDVLGVNLLYNIFDKYILVQKRFCNNTIRTLNEKTESSQGVMFLGLISDIEYRKSDAGNNYAKVFFRDNDSTIRVYLWGEQYRKYISTLYKNKVYLVEVNFNKDKDTSNIVNIREADDIEIEKYIQAVTIYLDDPRSAVKAKFYIDNHMFGSKYTLYFNYKGEVFKAPFKINFNEDDYLYLKYVISDLLVEK